MAFIVGSLSLLVYGLGIPLMGLFLLFKNRHTIDSIEIKERLGFLYSGFKIQYYYWEIVVMCRKIAIVAIQIIFVSYGVIT